MSDDWPGRYERQSDRQPQGGHLVGTLLRILVTVAVIVAGFAALRNVFSDTFEVERMAVAKACEGHGPSCRAQMTRWERTAFGQTFDMHTSRGSVIVRCQREHYLVGDYRCMLRDAPAAITTEPQAPASKPSAPTAGKPARSAIPQDQDRPAR